MSWVMRNGKIVLKGGPEDIRSPVQRSSLPRPMVISDHIPNVVNPINGKPYDSKSAYYRDVRAAGCTIMGNDRVKAEDRETGDNFEPDVARAFNQLT
jgi:hypothetical protein